MKISLVKKSKLDDPIDKILLELNVHDPESSEYATNLTNLERLRALQDTETWTRKIDPTQVAAVAANLLGIGLIVNYEKLNVVTTKAIGMIMRKPT